jgi:hypothetical protein
VPLSPEDERILQEIAEHLYESDPNLVREVSTTTVYRHAGRNLKYAGTGFIAGFVFLLAMFDDSLLLGGVGFGVMLAAAVFFERNLRRMGKAGWRDWSESVSAAGLKDAFASFNQRARDRFKRE